VFLSYIIHNSFVSWYNRHMIDHDTIKAIQADIELIEPLADVRRYKQRVKREKYMREYNDAYYDRNKQALRKRARQASHYEPVLQSPIDVPNDVLNDL